METTYRSTSFLADARDAIHQHEPLNIFVNGGWRGRILAKEVAFWLPFDDVELIKIGPWRAPSALCSILMPALHAVHYIALTANYEMRSEIERDHVILRYVPL